MNPFVNQLQGDLYASPCKASSTLCYKVICYNHLVDCMSRLVNGLFTRCDKEGCKSPCKIFYKGIIINLLVLYVFQFYKGISINVLVNGDLQGEAFNTLVNMVYKGIDTIPL